MAAMTDAVDISLPIGSSQERWVQSLSITNSNNGRWRRYKLLEHVLTARMDGIMQSKAHFATKKWLIMTCI